MESLAIVAVPLSLASTARSVDRCRTAAARCRASIYPWQPEKPGSGVRARVRAETGGRSVARKFGVCLIRLSGMSTRVPADVIRAVWLRSLRIHLRAARAHDMAAERFIGLRDAPGMAQAESERERAVAERQEFRRLLATHPEWERDASELRLLASWPETG